MRKGSLVVAVLVTVAPLALAAQAVRVSAELRPVHLALSGQLDSHMPVRAVPSSGSLRLADLASTAQADHQAPVPGTGPGGQPQAGVAETPRLICDMPVAAPHGVSTAHREGGIMPPDNHAVPMPTMPSACVNRMARTQPLDKRLDMQLDMLRTLADSAVRDSAATGIKRDSVVIIRPYN